MRGLLPNNPLARTIVHYHDDHKVLIACDDTYAPKQYFSNVELPRTEIVLLPTTDTKSYIVHVLNRLLQEKREKDDELWLVLDTDHCVNANNVGRFSSEIGRAERAGIHVALSRPCFEYWLALHHVDSVELDNMDCAKQLERKLNEVVSAFRRQTTGYSKVNVQYFDFPHSLLANAIRRARKQDEPMKRERVPVKNTTRIYCIWESLLKRFEEFQVPERYLEAYREIKTDV